MAERVVESSVDEVPEIPEILEKVILYSLDRAKAKVVAGETLVPFTSLAVKETLFMKTHPADDEEACFNLARHTVEHARGAQAYAFTYDGYVEMDDGAHDVIIAEGGQPGEDKAFAVGLLYTQGEDGAPVFEDEPVYIGPAPNFMVALRAPGEYDEDEIDEKYREDNEDFEREDVSEPAAEDAEE